MFFLGVGPSLSGKTTYIRDWLIPMLCWKPELLTDGSPPEGFKFVLIDDPRSRRYPEGQYPGKRYADTNAWRRDSEHTRLCCFERADPEELFRLAYEEGDCVVVLDEIDNRLGHVKGLGYWSREACIRGRHDGIAIVGGTRSFMGVQTIVRRNVQYFFCSSLADPNDRMYAAKTIGVDERVLIPFHPEQNPAGLPKYHFAEFRKEYNQRALTKIENRARIVVSTI